MATKKYSALFFACQCFLTSPAYTSPKASCGNGRLDRGEVCDYSISTQLQCPQGWGTCKKCTLRCKVKLHNLRPVKMTTTSSQGTMTTQNQLSPRGNVVHSATIFHSKNHQSVSEIRRRYDSNGLLLFEEERHEDSSSPYMMRYSYNSKGQKISSHFSIGGTHVLVTTSAYDPKGNLLRETNRSKKGRLQTETQFVYDNKNRLLERVVYRDDGRVIEKANFDYDQNGNLVHQKLIDESGKILQALSFSPTLNMTKLSTRGY